MAPHDEPDRQRAGPRPPRRGLHRGFTYTVLDNDDDVVGCVYIYPDDGGTDDAQVLSWVRAERAELDGVLRTAVANWLRKEWPFTTFRYEGT